MWIPAGVHREILGVIGVLFILFEIQLGEKLAGFHHSIITVLQNSLGSVHLREHTPEPSHRGLANTHTRAETTAKVKREQAARATLRLSAEQHSIA